MIGASRAVSLRRGAKQPTAMLKYGGYCSHQVGVSRAVSLQKGTNLPGARVGSPKLLQPTGRMSCRSAWYAIQEVRPSASPGARWQVPWPSRDRSPPPVSAGEKPSPTARSPLFSIESNCCEDGLSRSRRLVRCAPADRGTPPAPHHTQGVQEFHHPARTYLCPPLLASAWSFSVVPSNAPAGLDGINVSQPSRAPTATGMYWL